jgi:hypothetical protein
MSTRTKDGDESESQTGFERPGLGVPIQAETWAVPTLRHPISPASEILIHGNYDEPSN